MYTYNIRVVADGVYINDQKMKEGSFFTIESNDHCLDKRCSPNDEIRKCLERQGKKLKIVWNTSFEVFPL